YEDITEVGSKKAWHSHLTNFPKSSLAYNTNSEIKSDIESVYKNATVSQGSIHSITYLLSFDKGNNPVAKLKGMDENGENCYAGSHDLITKKGEIHWSGPCEIN